MTWIGASERTATRRHRRLLAAGLIAVTALITAALIRPVPRGEAGGRLPDDVTVFDEEYPGVTKLDPDLLQALRAAATEASSAGNSPTSPTRTAISR